MTPATERFTCMYSGGWMVLSDALRILRLEVSQPEGLILLNQIFRHSNLETTRRYIGLAQEDIDKVFDSIRL